MSESNEIITRIAKSRLTYNIVGRSGHGSWNEWFIDDSDNLPAGVFVAGPFPSEEEAWEALEIMNARAAIAAMLEPTEAMITAGGAAPIRCWPNYDHRQAEVWRAMISEALK